MVKVFNEHIITNYDQTDENVIITINSFFEHDTESYQRIGTIGQAEIYIKRSLTNQLTIVSAHDRRFEFFINDRHYIITNNMFGILRYNDTIINKFHVTKMVVGLIVIMALIKWLI